MMMMVHAKADDAEIGIMTVCMMDLNIANIPHTLVRGSLGNKNYARFEYKLRLSFGEDAVLGFSLDSMDGQEYGHRNARYSLT